MRKALTAIFILLTLAQPSPAQKARRAPHGLPAGALVVEERPLAVAGGRKRALLLWMLRPQEYPRGGDETYTCPEETRGSFRRGPARVSLLDAGAGRVINTVKVTQGYNGDRDEFDLPYRIRAGGHYHVPATPAGREGRPAIMRLRDFNGDGRAHEFALFDALACMGLETALFGYSERLDRVVQYSTSLESEYRGEKTTDTLGWVDYLFSREPAGPGRWKYEVDYRGRGGTLDSYEVRWDEKAGRFEGTVRRTPGEQ